MLITSRANPTVKKLVSLAEKKYRREYGEYIGKGAAVAAFAAEHGELLSSDAMRDLPPVSQKKSTFPETED